MNNPRWKLIKQLITIYGDLLTTILVTLVFIPAATIHLFEDMDISFMKVFGITIILFLAFVCLLIFILYAYSRFVKLLKSNIVLETTTMKQIPDSVSQEQLESDMLYQFIILASTLWLLSFHASPPWDDVCRVALLVLFVVFAWWFKKRRKVVIKSDIPISELPHYSKTSQYLLYRTYLLKQLLTRLFYGSTAANGAAVVSNISEYLQSSHYMSQLRLRRFRILDKFASIIIIFGPVIIVLKLVELLRFFFW